MALHRHGAATFDCMTAAELALWAEAAEVYRKHTGSGARQPCTDCPMAFRLAATFRGTCRLPVRVRFVRSRSGPPRRYSRAEIHERQRVQKRDHMRRMRARARNA